MDSLNLRVPEQGPPGKGAFDCSKQAVEQWCAGLPLGNMGESARMLYGVLYETNRLTLSVEQRKHLLDSIATPLHSVVESFLYKLSNQPLPLPGKALEISQFLQQLLSEAIIAYQAILDSHEQGSWLFRMAHHKLWPQSMHRMLHYMGQLLQTQRLTHQPYASGLWLAIHKLYQEARKNELHEKNLVQPWPSEFHQSIEQAYLQAQLSALVDPALLTSEQQALVREQLPAWSLKAQLLEPTQWGTTHHAYWIRLDADSPHTTPAAHSAPEALGDSPALLLELSALQQAIQEKLAATTDETPGKLTQQTLTILAQAWQVPTDERKTRQPGHHQHRAALGISALFSLLRRENMGNRDGISDQHYGDELKALVPLKPKKKTGRARSNETVWDSLFFPTELTSNSWSADEAQSEYHYISATEGDASSSGFRLLFNSSDVDSLSTGELIGLRSQPGATMQLGEIRWVEQQQDKLNTGVMLLSNEIEPVLCIMHDGEHNTPLAGLLGIGLDGHPQLYLPNLPGLSARQLTLVVDGYEVPIELRRCQAVSSLFISHHFALHPSIAEEGNLEEGTDLEALNLRLHQLTHHDSPRPQRKPAQFDELWDKL